MSSAIRRVAAATAFVAAVQLGAMAWTGTGQAVSSDEGAAIRQSQLAARGSTAEPLHLPAVDPTGARQPYHRADVTRFGRVPYAKHPAYPLLLRISAWAGGASGMSAVGVVSVIVASACAGLAASRLDARAGPIATLGLGLLSPLAVDAHLVLAHAPAAAAVAAALVAAPLTATPATRSRGAARWLAVGALLAVATLLRTEALFLGPVVGAVVAASVLARHAAQAPLTAVRSAERLFVAGLILVPTAVAAVADRAWSGVVSGAPVTPTVPITREAFIPGRLRAVRESFLAPAYGGDMRSALLVVGPVALLVAVVLIRRRGAALIIVLLAGVAPVVVARWLAGGHVDLVPGLVVACPSIGAFIGLASRRSTWPDPRHDPEGGVALATLLCALPVFLTQYSFGGGAEWGGRFYAILLPIAAIPIAVWTVRWWDGAVDLAVLPTRIVLVCAAVATGAMTVGGFVTVRQSHRAAELLERTILAQAELARPFGARSALRPVVVTSRTLLPQLIWPISDQVEWLVPEDADLRCALIDLHRVGRAAVVLVSIQPRVDEATAASAGWLADLSAGRGGATLTVTILREASVDGARDGCEPATPLRR